MRKLMMRGVRTSALSTLVAVGLATASFAQDDAHQDGAENVEHQAVESEDMMEGHDGGAGTMHGADHAAPGVPGSLATEAYRAANLSMHSAMDIEFSGDADVDFARGMIGHHQGAIDMARIVLEHGEDPDLRQLAEAIIEAQEAEIAFLREWIAEHAPG